MAKNPKLVELPPAEAIAKPEGFALDKFKSKRAAAMANVETLQTGLPLNRAAEAKDFVRLHPDEENYWSSELCFVNVPIKGQKRDTLHLIEEDLAMQIPAERQDQALPLGTRDQALRRLLPLQRPDAATWTTTGTPATLTACEQAKTLWVQATSREGGGCRRLQDRLRPRSGRLSRAEMADAIAR